MKRILTLIFVAILALSLCACGECEHTFAEANCTTPKTCTACGVTEGKALGHSFADATCTAPKTCACGATEGEALGHTFTQGKCETCQAAQPDYHAFADCNWTMSGVIPNTTELDIITLSPSGNEFGDGGFISVSFWAQFSELSEEEQEFYLTLGEKTLVEFEGEKYSSKSFGTFGNLTFTESGNTVVVTIEQYYTATVTMERISGTEYKVVAKEGIVLDEGIDKVLTVGSILTYIVPTEPAE